MQISQSLFGGEQLFPPPSKFSRSPIVSLVNTFHNNKLKRVLLKALQVNSSIKFYGRIIFNKILSILYTNLIRQSKDKRSVLRTTLISPIKFFKQKRSTLSTLQTAAIGKFEGKISILKFISILQTTLINQFKQKSTSTRVLGSPTIIQNKVKITQLKILEISNIVQNKLKSSYIKIVSLPSIKRTLIKNTLIKVLGISIPQIFKSKNSTIRSTQLNRIQSFKVKLSNLRVTNILSILNRKSKRASILLPQINSLRVAKFTKKFIRVDTISSIFTLRNQHIKKTPTAAQVVSATIIKAPFKGITSGITYTIGNSRRVTYVRIAKAVSIRILNNIKSVHKQGIVNNINLQSLSNHKIWRFVLKFITKITSLNSQFVIKTNYGIASPDIKDPNMIDNSVPIAEGLVGGEADDDSFIP